MQSACVPADLCLKEAREINLNPKRWGVAEVRVLLSGAATLARTLHIENLTGSGVLENPLLPESFCRFSCIPSSRTLLVSNKVHSLTSFQ